jgi:hypothetical protein
MDWEMQWAQAALQRNPQLEIVAADRETRVFTVRDRQSDAVTSVQLADIAAAPLAFLNSGTAPTAPARTPGEPAEPAAPELAPEPEAALALAPVTKSPPSYTIERSGGQTKIIGAGISVVYGDDVPAAPTVISAGTTPTPYTVDRSRGLVRVSGPGVSIETSKQPGATMTPAGAEIEPVICEGQRVMQLDSRTIYVEGDALTARGGCELYITNSTIVASGTGVIIRDATVHINNSRIEGGLASFDAKEQAKVFLRGSTLNGLPRRNERALIQDQGGNKYQ